MSDVSAVDTTSQRMLVQAAQAGDARAWQDLMALHAPRLAAYIGARLRRPDIVDRLVADSILVAWKNRAQLTDVDAFSVWFRRMGASVTMRWYKRHSTESISGTFPLERCDDARLGVRIAALDEALGRLPEKERMALEQYFRAGLDVEAIAEVLHKTPEQVDVILESGLRHIDALRFQWDTV